MNMKAKVIREERRAPLLKEGEIVDIVPGMETDSEGIWNISAGKLVLCKKEDGRFSYASPLDLEIVDHSSVDWDSFRREAAKDIVCAILSAGMEQTNDKNEHFKTFEELAKVSVAWADELIKQLKEDEK